MISITKYLFEQDYVPVPQAVIDARANSLAAMRTRMAANGRTSLAPGSVPNAVSPIVNTVKNNTPLTGISTNVVKKIAEPSTVDIGTWGKLANKTVQAVTN